MKNTRGICFVLMLVLLGTILAGCREDKPDSDKKAPENTLVHTFPADMSREDFVKEVRSVPGIDENTLLYYTNDSMSEGAAKKLNALLKDRGYDFQVKILQAPASAVNDMDEKALYRQFRAEGARIDILPVNTGLREAAGDNLLMDMTDFLDTSEGAILKKSIPGDFWEMTAIAGKHYGIGNIMAPEPGGWAVNKALMEKYNIKKEELAKPLWELEDVIRRVYEGEKNRGKMQGGQKEDEVGAGGDDAENGDDFVTFALKSDIIQFYIPFTMITEAVGVFHDDASVTAVNLYASEYFRKLAETTNKFFKAGYIGEYRTGMRNFFMALDWSGLPVYQDQDINEDGVEVIRIPYYGLVKNCVVYPSVYGVTGWSKKKEQAMRFLSFVYQDEKASNLLRHGANGKDYTVNKEGFAEPAGGRAAADYFTPSGNGMLTVPVAPHEPLNKKEQIPAYWNRLKTLPIHGFVFDPSPVRKQVKAVNELCEKIATTRAIIAPSSGEDPKAGGTRLIEPWNEQLKAAGIDAVVKEANRQIREYLKQ